MTQIKTEINRRSFLKVSAAGGAGLMIGFNWLTSCTPAAEQVSLPEEWYDINAFIKIGDNGLVTLFSPNPEIGQNVKTSMPLIVAEELDVDWKNVIVEQAGLSTEKYTRQLAGGSQSIRKSWKILRTAGATARRMLMQAAADKWEVDISNLSTTKGIIKNEQTGQTMGYGEIATAAAAIEIPQEVTLKNPEDFKLIGEDIRNVDGKKIVTGQPLFGLDYEQEGMMIAMIVHAPAFGMKLKSMDGSEALAMPGIKDVFQINSSPKTPNWSFVNAFPELVVIVGESTWQVMKAKKKVKLDWVQETPAENSQDHHAKLLEAIAINEGDIARQDGDPDKVNEGAAKVIEKSYSAPFLAHNTLEPMNFFADVTNDAAKLVGPIQTPAALRNTTADVLDLPIDKVTVDMTRMGGGFGRRLYGHFGLEAALISKKIGAPVKLIYKREDDMTQGTYRPAYRVKYKAGLGEKGELLSFQVKGVGIPSNPLFPNRFPAGSLENYKAEGLAIETNISTGAWRAPRSNFIAGAEQSFIDEVAEEAGADPIEFRLNLLENAIKNPVGEKNDYDPERYAGVLKLVREKSGWGKEMPDTFRGVSAYFCHNSYIAQVVDVVKDDGKEKIKKVWCAVDCGIVVNKIAATNQIEGGIIDGIGHSMYSQVTFENGIPIQSNFDRYKLLRNTEAPLEIEVFFVDNGIDPTGLGEPSLPPISAAVANAMYKATGKRWYHQPFTVADQSEVSLG